MHIHLRIQHWVLWWFDLGVVCGVVAIINILMRDLTRTQDKAILVVGVVFWLLGGLVCYAFEGVRIERPGTPESSPPGKPEVEQQTDWHPASDFVLPGTRKPLLPPK